MVLIRCRHYDQDGNAKGKGCWTRGICKFIHPGEPNWDIALNKDLINNKGDRGQERRRGSGRGEFGSTSRSASGSWGQPPSVSPGASEPTKTWGTSGWGASSSATASSSQSQSAGKSAGKSNEWGNGDKSPTWGNTTSNDADTGAGGWGSDTWGTGDSWGGSVPGDSGGWGGVNVASSISGWGRSTTATNDPREESLRALPRANKGGNEPAKIRISTSPKPKLESKPLPDTNTVPSDPRLRRSMSLEHSARASPAVSTPSMDWSRIPMTNGLFIDTDIHSDRGTATVPLSARSAAPSDQLSTYRSTIKNIQNIVRYQIEVEAAQQDVSRWKRTQSSQEYGHPTPATQAKLEALRHQYHSKLFESQKKLNHAIKLLKETPELSSASGSAFNPEEVETKVLSYTAELKAWLQDLALDDRVAPPSPPAPKASVPPEEHGEAPDKQQAPTVWTWETVSAAIDDLDARVEAAQDLLYNRTCSHDIDLEERVRAVIAYKKANAEEPPEPSEAANILGEANANFKKTEAQFLEGVTSAVALLGRLDKQEEELRELRAQRDQLAGFMTQMEAQFAQYEQWQREDQETIDKMTEQIRNLHTLRPSPASPLAIDVDSLLPSLNTLVVDQIHQDISPILDSFRQACTKNNEWIAQELQAYLQPALDTTKELLSQVQQEAAQTDIVML